VVAVDPIADALARLRTSIADARRLLDSLRTHLHRHHLLLDSVIARYLYGAIASAEVVEVAFVARHPEGAEPVVRHLFETGVDLLYLLSDPNSDAAAARTLVWNSLDWEEQWQHRTTLALDERRPAESAEDAVLTAAKWLRDLGDDDAVLRQEFADAQRRERRAWHWSGRSRRGMLQELEDRGSEPTLVPMLNALSDSLSDAAHASARWHTLPAELDAATRHLNLPDPAVAAGEVVVEFGDRSRTLLRVSCQAVTWYQQAIEKQSAEAS
jgi:hypothetical protein